jgi:hypothetical protein
MMSDPGWCSRHDAIKTTSGCPVCLKAEVERLKESEAEWKLALETCHAENEGRAVKIEAALAIPKDKAFDLSEGEIIEWMVKALKGGEDGEH